MANTSKDIKFLSRNDMLELAKKMYKNVKDDLNGDTGYASKETYSKHIHYILKKHQLVPKEGVSPDEKVISEDVATFIIGDLLCDYFLKDSESARQRRRERKEERMKKLRERSRKMDKKLNETEKEFFEAWSQLQAKEYAGESVDVEGFFKRFPHLSPDHYDATVYRYHLPIISSLPEYEGDVGGLPYGLTDQVVDRMMLRAIFDMFYDFDEIGFRRDFAERSKLIIPTEPCELEEGYSELTQMLEEPLKYYVSVKKERKKKTKEPFCMLDPDTEKRIKQYADEHNIPVSKAIHDWIWSQTLKSDKKENK